MRRAIDYYEQALAIAREIGDRRSEGAVLGNLSITYRNLGFIELAAIRLRAALAIFKEIESPHAKTARAELADLEDYLSSDDVLGWGAEGNSW